MECLRAMKKSFFGSGLPCVDAGKTTINHARVGRELGIVAQATVADVVEGMAAAAG